MKPFFNHYLLLIILLTTYHYGKSQLYDSLSVNRVNARIWADGLLFNDKAGNAACEWPAGGGKHPVAGAGLWLSAIDAGGQLHVAAQTHQLSGADYWPGPLIAPGTGVYDAFYDQRYNRVWKVTRAAIDAHIAAYSQPGYALPAALAEWPGNGLTINGEPVVIAPYADVNGNFFYDPLNGDYPLIPGDEAVFAIFNDARHAHTLTGGSSLGAEVRLMLYGFHAPQDTVLQDVIFGSYAITNRSGGTWEQFSAGQWQDLELGFYRDDYMGCDTLLNAVYAYNGDANDEGQQGYSLSPPASGMVLLNQPMEVCMAYKNNASVAGWPENDVEYDRYMQGRWRDGTPLMYGYNNNLNPNEQQGDTVSCIYTGNPAAQTGWTERLSGNEPGDRLAVSATRFGALPAGETACLDLAWVSARAFINDQFGSLQALTHAFQGVKDFYTANPLSCTANGVTAVSGPSTASVEVFPNPVSGNSLTVRGLPASGSSLQLTDIQGRTVSIQTVPSEVATLPVGGLAPGMYLLHIDAAAGKFPVQKVLIR